MNKSHAIKLYPTYKQETLLRKSCGVARFAYNWALAEWEKRYKEGDSTSAYTLIKELTAIKRKEFPWMMEVTKSSPQYAIHNPEKAYKGFFAKKAKHPKFKKKGVKDSFVAVENKENFKQKDKKIWLPRIGWVKCAEDLRFDGKVNNVVVKRVADKWFAVVSMETIPKETLVTSENQAVIGVDLGIKSMAVVSDGRVFQNPKALKNRLESLKRLNRQLSRKQAGSNNRRKAKMRLARLYYRISCIRSNAIHQATTAIVKSAGTVVIEDLAVSNMIKNAKLSQALSDVSLSEFRRQIEYKAKWSGVEVVVSDRFFPSTKKCSCCGHVNKKIPLQVRVFECIICGHTQDRDLNAAINLKQNTPKSGGINAFGVGKFHATEQVADIEEGNTNLQEV